MNNLKYRKIFIKSSSQCLVLEGILKGQESKIGTFYALKCSCGGPQNSKKLYFSEFGKFFLFYSLLTLRLCTAVF